MLFQLFSLYSANTSLQDARLKPQSQEQEWLLHYANSNTLFMNVVFQAKLLLLYFNTSKQVWFQYLEFYSQQTRFMNYKFLYWR